MSCDIAGTGGSPRIGVARWAPRLLVVLAAGLAVIAAGFQTGVPGPFLVVITGVIAAVAAGLGGSTRVLLSERVPKQLLSSALSLDSSVIELVVITAQQDGQSTAPVYPHPAGVDRRVPRILCPPVGVRAGG